LRGLATFTNCCSLQQVSRFVPPALDNFCDFRFAAWWASGSSAGASGSAGNGQPWKFDAGRTASAARTHSPIERPRGAKFWTLAPQVNTSQSHQLPEPGSSPHRLRASEKSRRASSQRQARHSHQPTPTRNPRAMRRLGPGLKLFDIKRGGLKAKPNASVDLRLPTSGLGGRAAV
jgi:hypothetical protein